LATTTLPHVLQELCKSCARLVGRSIILFYFGAKCKIIAQLLCKSFILFYFILLQMGEPLK